MLFYDSDDNLKHIPKANEQTNKQMNKTRKPRATFMVTKPILLLLYITVNHK